jgi:hypothetical protein
LQVTYRGARRHPRRLVGENDVLLGDDVQQKPQEAFLKAGGLKTGNINEAIG